MSEKVLLFIATNPDEHNSQRINHLPRKITSGD